MITNINDQQSLYIIGESTITKSSSETSAKQDTDNSPNCDTNQLCSNLNQGDTEPDKETTDSSESCARQQPKQDDNLVGTISYVEDDGIVSPSMMESTQAYVDQATKVTLVAVNKI